MQTNATNESDQWGSQSSDAVEECHLRLSENLKHIVRGDVLSIGYVKTPKGRKVRVVGRGLKIEAVKNPGKS